ncbi:hypothetical protein BGP_2197 [Beggiatoa sp. PS]|nr:hypothetical protein BGP_2197 [Beggiatoa sp. PS]
MKSEKHISVKRISVIQYEKERFWALLEMTNILRKLIIEIKDF